jgi:drug/metabolite transporter (DMT)-like permease
MAVHVVGMGLAIVSMLGFSVTYAFYKAALPFLPNTLVIFFQSLFSWCLILPFFARKESPTLSSHRFPIIALRTIFGIFSLYCITKALTTTSLAEVVLLNNTAPLFIPFIAWFALKERIDHRLWASILVGFLGVLIVIRPGFTELNSGLLYALAAGIFSALLLVCTRYIAHEPFLRILFYYFLIFCVVFSPFLFSEWHMPPPEGWLYLFLAAVAMIGGQLSFTAAARFAPSQEIAPFIYTGVIFSGLIDWFVWKESVSFISWIGMAVVCVGGILTLVLKRRGT